jgi:glycosyltransferase involved in cell wall biosynthesis
MSNTRFKEAYFLEELKQVLGEAALGKLGIYQLPQDFKLSVAMPVYNEKATIREIIRRVQNVPVPKELIIVDDGSTDGTREELKQIESDRDLRIFYHEYNQGKGAALRTAFKYVTGDVVIIQDADLEYDPIEYLRLIQPIVDGRADVVYGSRFTGDIVRVHLFWHRIANGLLTLFSNLFTNLNLTDMETCYKAFRREALATIDIKQNRFGVEPELTAKLARRKCRIYEMPISYRGRDYAEGKKIGFKDALNALYCIIRYRIAD